MLRLYIAYIEIICSKNKSLFCKYINLYVANIEICVFYKFGATGAVPAGAFFSKNNTFFKYVLKAHNIDFRVLDT